jgi:hypothetical protein
MTLSNAGGGGHQVERAGLVAGQLAGGWGGLPVPPPLEGEPLPVEGAGPAAGQLAGGGGDYLCVLLWWENLPQLRGLDRLLVSWLGGGGTQ